MLYNTQYCMCSRRFSHDMVSLQMVKDKYCFYYGSLEVQNFFLCIR
jgi:hypothetical protein